MCTIRLMGPKTAARRLDWNAHWDFMTNPGEAAFVQMLWDAEREWVAEFVEAVEPGQPRQPRTQHQREPVAGAAVRGRSTTACPVRPVAPSSRAGGLAPVTTPR